LKKQKFFQLLKMNKNEILQTLDIIELKLDSIKDLIRSIRKDIEL